MTKDKFQTARDEEAKLTIPINRSTRTVIMSHADVQHQLRESFFIGADWAREFTLEEKRAHMNLQYEHMLASVRAENVKLRAALKTLCEHVGETNCTVCDDSPFHCVLGLARAVLGEGK